MKRIDIKGDIVPEGYDGVTTIQVSQKLNEAKGEDIIVFINSRGGDFFSGVSIYNQLKTYSGNVITVIDGLSASAGSIISMAGDKRYAMKGATYLCHMPSTIAWGDSKVMLKAQQELEILNNSLMEIYEDSFTGTREELKELLFEDKFIAIQEAIDKGFLDGIITPDEVKELFIKDDKNKVQNSIDNETLNKYLIYTNETNNINLTKGEKNIAENEDIPPKNTLEVDDENVAKVEVEEEQTIWQKIQGGLNG